MSNAINADDARLWINEIRNELSELESLRGEYMARCKTVRGRIAEKKDRANDAGIPRVALNAFLKRLALQERIDDLEGELEVDTAELLAQLQEAFDFGSTPLGSAAKTQPERDVEAGRARAAKEHAEAVENAKRIAPLKPKRGKKDAAPTTDSAEAIDALGDAATDTLQ